VIEDEFLAAMGEASYEKRILAYFDVLGWREKIERAAHNPHRLAQLRLVTIALGVTKGTFEEQGGHLSSFSDNVVISVPFNREAVQEFVETISRIQVGLAMWGFFIRGAVTIGDVFHDAASVFGPALNRAYELESKVAIYPRVLFDPKVSELKEIDFPVMPDGELRFLDPFYSGFLDTMRWRGNPAEARKFFAEHGGHPDRLPFGAQLSSREILLLVLHYLAAELRTLHEPKHRAKLEWLFDRIAPRIPLKERGRNHRPG
jgi:hypothetical protein